MDILIIILWCIVIYLASGLFAYGWFFPTETFDGFKCAITVLFWLPIIVATLIWVGVEPIIKFGQYLGLKFRRK